MITAERLVGLAMLITGVLTLVGQFEVAAGAAIVMSVVLFVHARRGAVGRR